MNDKNIEELGVGGRHTNATQLLTTILDSNLITATNNILYDIKLVDCNDVIQVYCYENKKVKRVKKDSDLKLVKTDNIDIKNTDINLKEIDFKNILRSKLECQRLAKANINEWNTFITLTFEKNITNVKEANKKFHIFTTQVNRVFKDFKYLCVTEFQKRGAIHYHLLTNIDIDNTNLFYSQEDNKKFKHIKYWNEGFNSVEVVKGDPKKIIGYIAKYMTKNIDNRLFSHRRYFYSMNIIRPKSNFISFENKKELDFYNKKIQDKTLNYQNTYINPYDNSKVIFLEYSK